MLIYSTVSIRLEIKIKIKKSFQGLVWKRDYFCGVQGSKYTPSLFYASLEISRNTSTK
jgi:hypothetical protein